MRTELRVRIEDAPDMVEVMSLGNLDFMPLTGDCIDLGVDEGIYILRQRLFRKDRYGWICAFTADVLQEEP